MASKNKQYPPYTAGMFVLMQPKLAQHNRAGKDGMVHKDLGHSVTLSFNYNRHHQYQGIAPSPPELWAKSDTQFNTLGY